MFGLGHLLHNDLANALAIIVWIGKDNDPTQLLQGSNSFQVILIDPDYNGERIRKIIMQEVPQAKHAFLNRGEAVPKSKTKGRSLGVEHASFEDLEKALAGLVGSYEDENFFDITKTDLMRLGLLMGNDSRKRREYLGEALRIGYCNGKQLIKRLELFGICLAQVEEAMARY